MNFEYIDSNQALSEFCEQIKECKLCALDTEFLREKTYFPLLALIQLATETHQACIDPLKVSDFSPLVEIFKNRSMVKILHSPGQDLELFYQQFDALPEPVFDTQLAAAVLGYANQIGYADLVNRLCGVQLDKKHTRADWSKRPLSEGELDYAMDDVRYLLPMYSDLKAELEKSNRWSWVQADFQKMSDKAEFELDVSGLWKKLRGIQKLKGAALNNADQLCRWREQKAISSNRPRRWIMKDEDLIDIARFKPASAAELGQIGSLSEDYIRKIGDAVLKVLAEASQMDPADYPRQAEFTKLNSDQQAISDCLMAICRVVTEKNHIALASVTTKKEIDQLVAGNLDSKITRGWRNEMIGKHLVQFLQGKTSLSCRDAQLVYSE